MEGTRVITIDGARVDGLVGSIIIRVMRVIMGRRKRAII